jgi:hypothetical protein
MNNGSSYDPYGAYGAYAGLGSGGYGPEFKDRFPERFPRRGPTGRYGLYGFQYGCPECTEGRIRPGLVRFRSGDYQRLRDNAWADRVCIGCRN